MKTCPHCQTELASDTLFCPRCAKQVPGSQEDDLLASSASDPTGLLDRLRTATAGEFKIIRELGRGGMGRVYLAHELALERRVALKVLPPYLSEQSEVVERFQREARTAGKLNHPNIVAVFQVSERGGLHFFTMPYVAGPSLRQILKQTPQLSVELCRRYLREAADALAFAHGRGVVHRDIKPENMLLEGSRDGRLLLTDFGIAKALGSATTLTRPGDMMGTPYFMSPEQCEGAELIDGRSDQYSLGLVAYEMLAGRFPFSSDSLAGIVYKHLHEYPQPLDEVRADIPADLCEVIERAIRKNPDERFPNMEAMLEALGRASPGKAAARRDAAAPALQSQRRSRGRWLAAASLVAVATVVGGFALWQGSTGGDEPRLARLNIPAEQDTFSVGGLAPDSNAAGDPSAESAEAGEQLGSESRSLASQQRGNVPAPAEPGGRRDELAGERVVTEQAQSEAREARESARRVGADTIFPAWFTEVDGRFASAQSDLQAGTIGITAAALAFNNAKNDFEELESEALLRLEQLAEAAAAQTAGDEQQAESPEQGESDPAQTDPPRAVEEADGEPATPPPPREAIGALIEGYRQALEARDTARLAREIYQAAIPEADYRELYIHWFERATDLSVTIEVEDMEIGLDAAEVRAKQMMKYKLARTGDWRDYDQQLRMFFTRTEQGWRLERVER
ncbi:MAG: serine/threonine-protein kinase [Gemmatimonadales bacterium]|jgi:serine/threonine protein kinase